MPRNTYTKKINEWDLDIEYNYVPAEPSTHDYPGYGSTDEQVDMSDFFYELCPDTMRELEEEIVEDHENS